MDKDQNTESTAPEVAKTAPVVSGGQVMDIQAPTSGPSPASAGAVPSVSTSVPVATEETPEQVPDTIDEAPADAEPTPEVTATPPEESSSSNAPDASGATEPEAEAATGGSATTEEATPTVPVAHEPSENPLAITGQPKKKSAPIAAIIVAIIIALALSSLVIFVFMKSRNTAKQSASTAKTSNSQGIAPKPLASVSDVDATNKDIDTTLTKFDDTKDFATADLSDTALGL